MVEEACWRRLVGLSCALGLSCSGLCVVDGSLGSVETRGRGAVWDYPRFWSMANSALIGLYTDESPGLKVDPVVVLVLSLVFIFSVVALHSTSSHGHPLPPPYGMVQVIYANANVLPQSLPRSPASSLVKRVLSDVEDGWRVPRTRARSGPRSMTWRWRGENKETWLPVTYSREDGARDKGRALGTPVMFISAAKTRGDGMVLFRLATQNTYFFE